MIGKELFKFDNHNPNVILAHEGTVRTVLPGKGAPNDTYVMECHPKSLASVLVSYGWRRVEIKPGSSATFRSKRTFYSRLLEALGGMPRIRWARGR